MWQHKSIFFKTIFFSVNRKKIEFRKKKMKDTTFFDGTFFFIIARLSSPFWRGLVFFMQSFERIKGKEFF